MIPYPLLASIIIALYFLKDVPKWRKENRAHRDYLKKINDILHEHLKIKPKIDEN